MHSRRPDRSAARRGRRLPLALAFALALLAAQTLALLHGIAHGGGMGQRAPAASSMLKGWFGGHDADSAQCRLVDQLGHDALALADATPAVADLPSAPPVVRVADVRAGHDAPARRARGPPLLAG